eukprot:350980-Chlamydomonas_euryale.AAC.2
MHAASARNRFSWDCKCVRKIGRVKGTLNIRGAWIASLPPPKKKLLPSTYLQRPPYSVWAPPHLAATHPRRVGSRVSAKTLRPAQSRQPAPRAAC